MAKKTAPASAKSNAVLQALQKKFGKDAANTVSEGRSAAAQIKNFIPTGIDVLDNYVLGHGGLPIGRMTEVFGGEGSGKTSLGYMCLANVQKMGGQAILIDVEFSFDESRAALFGVDVDDLIVLQPAHLEELFSMLQMTLETNEGGDPMLIVWDSIAASSTNAETERDPSDKVQVAEMARVMSRELKKIPGLLHSGNAHLLMINQNRTKMGVMYGDPTTQPGGNAPKYYSSCRLGIYGGAKVKNSRDEKVGQVITFSTLKNRLEAPFRKARVLYSYANGFDNTYSTLELAKTLKVVDSKDVRGGGPEAYDKAVKALAWSTYQPFVPSKLAEPGDDESGPDIDSTDYTKD